MYDVHHISFPAHITLTLLVTSVFYTIFNLFTKINSKKNFQFNYADTSKILFHFDGALLSIVRQF